MPLLWIVILLVVRCCVSSQQASTPNNRNCTADPYVINQRDPRTQKHELENEFIIRCNGTRMYTVSFVNETYYNMECQTKTDLTIDDIPLQPSGPIGDLEKYFKFDECPVPSTSYAEIMKKLGVKSVKNLRIKGTTEPYVILNGTHLQGLTDLMVEDLVLAYNNLKYIANDTFEVVPNILKLDLSGNEGLFLPDGIFFPLIELKELRLSNIGLQTLPNGFLPLPMLEQLYMSRNILNLTSYTFSFTTNLQLLDLSSNSLTTLPRDLFNPLVNLKEADLSYNSLKILSGDMFKYNKKIAIINLTGNHLTFLPEHIFNLQFLKTLSLSNNKLEYLPEKLFFDANTSSHSNHSLEKLDLRQNKLKTLPLNIFKFLAYLKILLLNNNKIESLKSEHFASLTSLEILNVNSNQLRSIEFPLNLKIKHLDASNNQLGELTGYQSYFNELQQLEELDVHNNSFKRIHYDWLWELKQLRVLNVSQNRIDHIDSTHLNFDKEQDITVDLSNNNISFINMFNYEENLKNNRGYDANIILAGNPVICDCHLHDLFLYLENLKRRVKFFTSNIECARPSSLNGTKLSNIHPKELICEQNVDKCVLRLKPAKSARILDCSNGKMYAPIDWKALPPYIVSNGQRVWLEYNHTELILENGSLKRLRDVGAIDKNVTVLRLKGNKFNLEVGDIPPHIQELDLRNNSLRNIEEAVAKMIIGSTPRKLKISDNPFECNCDNSLFISLLQHHNTTFVVEDYELIRCSDNKALLEVNGPLCDSSTTPIVVVSVLAVLIVIAVIIYSRYQITCKVYLIKRFPWTRKYILKTVPVSANELKYDVFISYSHYDSDDVDEIVKVLEAMNYQTYIHERDWVGGASILDSIDSSIRESQTTIFFLTSEFVKSKWSCHEFTVAFSRQIEECCYNIIVVVKGDAKTLASQNKNIRNYIKRWTYIKWDDPEFKNRLTLALPERLSIKAERYQLKNTELSQLALK